MKAPVKQQPYQRPNTRGCGRDNVPPRHDYIVELKDLIAIPNIAERLKEPPGIERLEREPLTEATSPARRREPQLRRP